MRDGKIKKKNFENFIARIKNFSTQESHIGIKDHSQFGLLLYFGQFSGMNFQKCQSTIYSSFYCSYLLVVSASMRIYGVALVLFYIIALRAVGGVERLEMAVFEALQGKSK